MALHIANRDFETNEIQDLLIEAFGIDNVFTPAEAKTFLHEKLKASGSEKDAWEITKAVEYAVTKKQKVNVIKAGYGQYKFADAEMMQAHKKARVQKTIIASGPKSKNHEVEVESEIVSEKKAVIDSIDTANAIMNLVPLKANDYVPHGCYSVVRKVISQTRFAPIWIAGLSGNGKTFGVEQACAVEGRELVIVNISNETSEEDLIGSYILQDGNMIWKDGPVLVAMRRGAVLCLDEIDQARTSAIMGLNTIAQGRPYYNKKTNEVVTPAEGFQLVGTANTKGDGEGSDMFAGAQIMNEAFLERFSIIIEQPYPTKTIERKILQNWSDDDAFINILLDIAHANRKQFDEGEGSIVLTTRRLVHIANNTAIFGNNIEGLEYAIARFNKLDQEVIMELYKALVESD